MTDPLTYPVTPDRRPLYLAGPMTGIEKWNHPAFHAAAERLRGMGFRVVNPAENFDGYTGGPREGYMRLAINQVTYCDAVAVLPGWGASAGARLEVAVAGALGMPVVDAGTLLPIYLPDEGRAKQTDTTGATNG